MTPRIWWHLPNIKCGPEFRDWQYGDQSFSLVQLSQELVMLGIATNFLLPCEGVANRKLVKCPSGIYLVNVVTNKITHIPSFMDRRHVTINSYFPTVLFLN